MGSTTVKLKPHAKLTKLNLCRHLIGIRLGTNQHGHAGRALEDLLENWGVPINRGAGPDILVFGCEIKTRDRWAVSPQTIADMNIQDIKTCAYAESHVRAKFQQQLRVYTEDEIITHADIYDFNRPEIQRLIAEAYEHARQQLINNPSLARTSAVGFYGYFERKANSNTSYSFRLNPADMVMLENMACSNFHQLFEYV